MRSKLKLLRLSYGLAVGLLGMAGIPSDLKSLSAWVQPMEYLIEPYWVRALLVLSGMGAITWPQWWPKALPWARRAKAYFFDPYPYLWPPTTRLKIALQVLGYFALTAVLVIVGVLMAFAVVHVLGWLGVPVDSL